METITSAIIVEDEKHNLSLLLKLLDQYCPGVEVKSTASSVKDGVMEINKHQPDIVFLDIELPDGTGFDLLHEINHRSFATIFTTGYDKYAIKAIKYAAFDYLLKPLSITELRSVIQKYDEDRLKDIDLDNKIFITDNEKYRIIDCMNVLYLEAHDNYTFIHLIDNKILSSYSLRKFEESLPDFFFRSHKSYIVNLKLIRSVSRGSGGEIKLKNDTSLPIAFRRKSELLEKLKIYSP